MKKSIAWLAIAAALLAGCAEMQKLGQPEPPAAQTAPPPKPAAPQITEDTLRDRAKAQLAQGQSQYQAGEYDNAIKSLTASLDHGLLSKADQSRARKLLAFIHCVSTREAQCRDEFRKAFEINPEFALTPAEDGHPIWGPVYRDVRTQLIAEREAAAARSRPFIPLAKAEQMLADGLVKYDAGDYEAAHKLLQGAVDEGLKEKADKVRAMKHIAFTLCLRKRWRDCRGAFIAIYDVDPEFDLTPAEAGHPEWTRTFAGAKAQAKRDLARKAAAEKVKPPAASVPAKK